MLNQHLWTFGAGYFAETEPEENSLAVFFILVEIANINIAIRIDFNAKSISLIVGEKAFIDSAVYINSHT